MASAKLQSLQARIRKADDLVVRQRAVVRQLTRHEHPEAAARAARVLVVFEQSLRELREHEKQLQRVPSA